MASTMLVGNNIGDGFLMTTPALKDSAVNLVMPGTIGVGFGLFGGGADTYLRDGVTGQLVIQENTAGGAVAALLPVTLSGSPFIVGAATTAFGAGAGAQDVLFLRLGTGQLEQLAVDGTGAVTGVLPLTLSGGAAATIDNVTSILGTSRNYFGTGQDIFLRSGTGQLEAEEFTTAGTLVTGIGFTSGGAGLIVAASTTVIGTGRNYVASGKDVFLRLGTGQVQIDEFNAGGSLTGSVVLGGTIDGVTSVEGTGHNYFATGNDVFFRTGAGQLEVEEFNGSGALITGIGFTSGGVGLVVAPSTTVVGVGQNVIGTGKDVFLRLGTGQLAVDEFDAAGALTGSMSLVVSGGGASTIDGVTSVIGTGYNYFGTGTDIFLRSGTGQLEVEEFNGSGTYVTGVGLTSGGTALTVAASTTVVGTGRNYIASGRDVFLRLSTGQLAVDEFNAAGALTGSVSLVVSGGGASTIDGVTSVIGTGYNYFGNGTDIFLRSGTGQLEAEEFTNAGTYVTGIGFTSGGSALRVSDSTTVVGVGQNNIGTGSDVFLRLGTGQLIVDEFNAAGTLTGTKALTLSGGAVDAIDGMSSVVGTGQYFLGYGQDVYLRGGNGALGVEEFFSDAGHEGLLVAGIGFTSGGSALQIAPTTTAVGFGQNYLTFGPDVFLRLGTGQLMLDEFAPGIAGGGTLTGSEMLTLSNGAADVIDGLTRVEGAGHNYFGTGNDVYLRTGSGAFAIEEFNSGGTLINSVALPALGNGNSQQVEIGNIGPYYLDAPPGGSTLIGDGVADNYSFGDFPGAQTATIVNGIHGGSAAGELKIFGGITDTNIWFDRVNDTGAVSAVGNNLKIDILGTTQWVVIDYWFKPGSSYAQLADINLPGASGGALRIDSQIGNLVQAMASYETGHPGFDPTAPANGTITDSTLLTAVNSSWHH